ncbi:MAG: dTDP-4-dehydrorhamnose reductase [Alphaproteobacteria bacterium]|nr:dTDP-4-dehydrorhamnose reductase [Alphaproteobacteria bacterium]
MKCNRIAVLGANGQVGRALVDVLGNRATALTRAQADLSQPATLTAVLDEIAPDAVINAAAYTAVDKAEVEDEAAHTVNAEAPAILAQWCKQHDVPFIHYSTDYVFDGSGNTPWQESDAVAPCNIYGKTKLAGEQAIASSGGKFFIFRTSWVYDAQGANFLNTMLRLGAEREALNIVSDQIGAPSYAPHLAEYTVKVLDAATQMQKFPSGIYHMVNQGEVSWHGFANAIFEAARSHGETLIIKTVEPIPSSAYPTPAQRPLNSRLSCQALQHVFGITMPSWQEGLTQAMEQKYHASNHMPA